MTEIQKIGLWAALFKGRRSFQYEIDHAIEIEANWKRTDFQCNIILEEIPGWPVPMWGSDRSWLYIRRPEGVWKSRIPSDIQDGIPFHLYQKLTNRDGSQQNVGGMSLGQTVFGHGGWIQGISIQAPIEAADRDESASPATRGIDVNAHAVGSAWGGIVGDESKRLVVDGRDFFNEAPTFEMDSDWLIATDVKSGRRVAYPMHGARSFQEALNAGKFWIRFSGHWLPGFDVNVRVIS